MKIETCTDAYFEDGDLCPQVCGNDGIEIIGVFGNILTEKSICSEAEGTDVYSCFITELIV